MHVQGLKGTRTVPIGEFHLLPGQTPERETVLEPGDLVTHVTLPPPVPGSKQLYLKLRDRASYEFALASAAVVLTVASERVTRARIAMGGVGTKPWRSPEAEAALVGQPAETASFRRAAEAALQNARPQSETPSRSSWRSAASPTRSRPPPRADPRRREGWRRPRSVVTPRAWMGR